MDISCNLFSRTIQSVSVFSIKMLPTLGRTRPQIETQDRLKTKNDTLDCEKHSRKMMNLTGGSNKKGKKISKSKKMVMTTMMTMKMMMKIREATTTTTVTTTTTTTSIFERRSHLRYARPGNNVKRARVSQVQHQRWKNGAADAAGSVAAAAETLWQRRETARGGERKPKPE